MKKRRALILDKQKIYTDSFSLLLEKYTEFSSYNCFQDSHELINFLIYSEREDTTIFLEYYLEPYNGLVLLNEIRRISKEIKVLFITAAENPHILRSIRSHTPRAIINKKSGLDILLEALRKVEIGSMYICPISQKIIDSANHKNLEFLTARELEVLKHFANGKTIEQTAKLMYLSKHTVVSHRRNMIQKSKCSSLHQLVAMVKDIEEI